MKHINLEQRLQLARLLVAIAKKDKPAVVKYYTDMGQSATQAGSPCSTRQADQAVMAISQTQRSLAR